MNFCPFVSFLGIILVFYVENVGSKNVAFDANYKVVWGSSRVAVLNRGEEVQLSMDEQSGGSGFMSKLKYGSGFFHLQIKLPNKDSAGVVTAFYLSSRGKWHNELDVEFLGNRKGKPITLQTNMFVNGIGKREQRTLLWFDPTADFHSYKILWNYFQIVFYVDDIPIRIYKNKTRNGVIYPAGAMTIQGTIWDGDSWATDKGRTKTNWSNAPFYADFRDFSIEGCSVQSESSILHCFVSRYWWNQRKYWSLSADEHKKLQHVRAKYMSYDYCTDRTRHRTTPPECAYNI